MGQRVGRISMDLISSGQKYAHHIGAFNFLKLNLEARDQFLLLLQRALKDDPFLVDIAVDKKRTLLGLKAFHSKSFGSTGLTRGTKSKKLPKRKSYSKFGRLLLERADQPDHSNLAPLPLS